MITPKIEIEKGRQIFPGIPPKIPEMENSLRAMAGGFSISKTSNLNFSENYKSQNIGFSKQQQKGN